MRWDKRLQEVSWECIHFPERDPISKDVGQALSKQGVRVFEADMGFLSSHLEIFDRVAEAMDFPDYFGRNLDALEECLKDLSWVSSFRGVVLVLHANDAPWQRFPRQVGCFLEAWLSCAQEWARNQVSFHLVILFADGDQDD